MNYNYLLYFSVIAETEHYTTASARPGISQPALSSAPTDEAVLCTVDALQAALNLVNAGMGIAFIPNECAENLPGIRYLPLRNRH